jgi:hypothetical protein
MRILKMAFFMSLLCSSAFAAESKKITIWCEVPDTFHGAFAAAFYVHEDHSGTAWAIEEGTGKSAKEELPSVVKTGNLLRGNGFIGKIRHLEPNPFVSGQMAFSLETTASIPAATSIGAPSPISIVLHCAAYNGALESIETSGERL